MVGREASLGLKRPRLTRMGGGQRLNCGLGCWGCAHTAPPPGHNRTVESHRVIERPPSSIFRGRTPILVPHSKSYARSAKAETSVYQCRWPKCSPNRRHTRPGGGRGPSGSGVSKAPREGWPGLVASLQARVGASGRMAGKPAARAKLKTLWEKWCTRRDIYTARRLGMGWRAIKKMSGLSNKTCEKFGGGRCDEVLILFLHAGAGAPFFQPLSSCPDATPHATRTSVLGGPY